jgi:uncharacterized protein (TIGR04255 family)
VRVLGQVKFPRIAKLSEESYIANFQEAIRQDYPHFESEVIQGVELNLVGPALQHRVTTATVWRFFDKNRIVRVTLGADAITLETAKYVSRDDFLQRMKGILEALAISIRPSHVQRVGFRYVDRIEGELNLSALKDLVHQELLNVLQPDLMKHIDISMTELTSTTKEGKLIARYGLSPAGFSHDPDMAPPVGGPSWVLDVDSFSTACEGSNFDADMLCGELDKVAARAYAFFRWSVTSEFLRRFGG